MHTTHHAFHGGRVRKGIRRRWSRAIFGKGFFQVCALFISFAKLLPFAGEIQRRNMAAVVLEQNSSLERSSGRLACQGNKFQGQTQGLSLFSNSLERLLRRGRIQKLHNIVS